MEHAGPGPRRGQRLSAGSQAWDGPAYQARFDALAAQGVDVHGEADLVGWLRPSRVLDAGCGTGRVAVELHRRGIAVVGVDVDADMLAVARTTAPDIDWRRGDLATVTLEPGGYDVVVMAGNVLLFTTPATESAVVANLARALQPGGALVAGFSVRAGGYDLDRYDVDCRAAGLVLAERWSTWDRAELSPPVSYAVSLHRRPE
ncbi:MAG TPA: class I SAM-dependent methyltransferase [Acidimicrobiales bacterium]